jgi:hypothetical protein
MTLREQQARIDAPIRQHLAGGALTITELVQRTGWSRGAVAAALERLGATSRRDGTRRVWRLPPALDVDPLGDLDVAHAERVLASEGGAGDLDRLQGEYAGEVPRPCRCARPVVTVDDDGDRRCVRCGRPVGQRT